MKTRERYAPIDLHQPDADGWPSPMPALSAPEAERAARRLWRWALGEPLRLPVVFTTGNRYNWTHSGTLRLNPSRGWRHLAHDLSHLFWRKANPGEKPHSKHHARFEAKLVQQIIRRGWLDGKLQRKVRAAEPPAAPSLDDKRRAELARIEARMQRWQRKADRATKALAKLERRRKYYAARVPS